MNNGNVNYNDRNNNNYVLAFSEFQEMKATDSPFYITEESISDAHQLCLKNKKSTVAAVQFRVDERENVRRITHEIRNGSYYPTTSIAFLIGQREVFAAAYRDRVVHTWVATRIVPLLEQQFVPTTWNCRVGKGTLRAIQDVRNKIRILTENYTKDAYALIYDLSGFFMNIDREKAASRICRFVEDRYKGDDKKTLLWLLKAIITHAPENDCIRYGSQDEWNDLPKRKSLFYCHGLPIGDLPSQLIGNFELDIVDHFITLLFMADRYVDDNIMMSDNKELLLNTMPTIRQLLFLTCGAVVNPRKYKVINVRTDGFKYLGVIINKDNAYVSGKTVGKVYSLIHRYNNIKNKKRRARDFMNSMNSYLGLMKHYDTYNTRKKIFDLISPEWDNYLVKAVDYSKVTLARNPRIDMRNEIRSRRRKFNQLKYSVCHSLEQES